MLGRYDETRLNTAGLRHEQLRLAWKKKIDRSVAELLWTSQFTGIKQQCKNGPARKWEPPSAMKKYQRKFILRLKL